MSESNLWNRLRTNMVPDYWQEATRHEDKLQKGIADVSFCQDGRHGWVELKHVADWPARATTKVKIPHYSADQKAFLITKGHCAGNTWLLIQVGSDHLLYDYLSAQHIGELTKQEMIDLTEGAFWEGRLKYDELADAMRAFRSRRQGVIRLK